MLLLERFLSAGRFGLVGFLAWCAAELVASLFDRRDGVPVSLIVIVFGFMLFEIALLLIVTWNRAEKCARQASLLTDDKRLVTVHS